MSSLVSIVLPTYNVEKYLLKCLESVLSQTYDNYECIIIVDGATDKSYDIALDFCSIHDKFHVYWQENAGSGPARNKGLQLAKGDFVAFVDPDDWIEPNYIEEMIRIQELDDVDLVTTYANFVYYRENDSEICRKHRKIVPFVLKNKMEVRTNYIQLFDKSLISAPTRTLYRMSIIKNNNVEFPNLRRSQDIVFNYRYFSHINKLTVSDYVGYNYRVSLGDRLNRLKKDYYKTLEYIYSEILDLHKKWDVNLDDKVAASAFFIHVYSALEANVVRGDSVKDILSSPVISAIISKASPSQFNKRIVHMLLKAKLIGFACLAMKIIYQIKKRKN